MIPLQLEISNFMSYRQKATLDFTAVHVACIAGLNGAGKSSLLDAMTWGLFGQCRARRDDDVVNRVAAALGERAEVRFVFALEQVVYRIIRRKKVGKSMKLEFQVSHELIGTEIEARTWKSLNEGTKRETQGQIERVLNMHYEMFSNASFLLQGQADLFTTKTANQRKQILADLLGVSQWEMYREAAAERRKEREGDLRVLDGRLGDISQELEEQEARQEALQAAQLAAAEKREQLETKEALLTQLRQMDASRQQEEKMVRSLETQLAQSEQELKARRARREQLVKQLAEHEALVAQAEEIEAAQAAWEAAVATWQAWQEKFEQYTGYQQAQRPHEVALAQMKSQLEEQIAGLVAEEKRVAALVAEKPALEAERAEGEKGVAEVTAALTALVAQEEAYQAAREVWQKLSSERQLWAQERAQLAGRAKEAEKKRAERERLLGQLATAETAVTRLAGQKEALAEAQERLSDVTNQIQVIEQEQPRLMEQMNVLKERIDLLQGTDSGVCPICQQSLEGGHREAAVATLQADGTRFGDKYRQNKKRLVELEQEKEKQAKVIAEGAKVEESWRVQTERVSQTKARAEALAEALAGWTEADGARLAALEAKLADDERVKEQEKVMEGLQKALGEREGLEKRRAAWQEKLTKGAARLAQIEAAEQAWLTEGVVRQGALVTQLAEEAYGAEARAALAEIEAELAGLEFVMDEYEAARTAHEGLKGVPARYQALGEARAAIEPLAAAVTDIDEQVAVVAERIKELGENLGAAREQLAQMTAAVVDLRVVEEAIFRLREEEVAAREKVGATRQKLAVLDDLRVQREGFLEERAALTQLIRRLKLLEKACGRDGVQALLIEHALPEIEERANQLLERLTEGKMRVSFETQRQLKVRDALAETLEIRIRDEAGERPYENYSGGEQFRVNFAIRLALSQILAQRAGARLQTLVIDEGFGSQDPQGRQRLIEAINSIEDEFACILVITHIEALRDAFPHRIEVTKRAEGSQINVI
ncbi:MAG TPA: SMC family ATPase [Anaerolineae bacterium]|nr:SMC family ATPase [Anaerolineae bacterium]